VQDVKRWVTASICTVSFLIVGFALAFAEDAFVLPKGVVGTNAEFFYYFPIDERYDPDGDAEDVAADYNTKLDSRVFPGLGLVEQFFQMPTGSANVGQSIVSFDLDLRALEITAAYGITDRLSAGIKIPYRWAKTDVDSRLDTSKASVGKNVPLNTLAPLGVPGTVPLTKRDVIDLLGKGLDINGDGTLEVQGFGYEDFESHSHNGLGDIELGAKYQYYKTENWRLAVTSGIRLPSGERDDPNNLVDYHLGNGVYAIFFTVHNDYTGIKNLLLNASFKYDIQLPDEEKLRVPSDVNLPITRDEEKVDRDTGDVGELEFLGRYTVARGFDTTLLYRYGFKQKDSVSGDKGYAYESLEDETDYTEHIFIARLTYTTLPLYMEKKFPVPLSTTLSYRNRFAGSNNALKSEYISLALQVFF
jgi:hypothetical protein